MGKSEIDFEAMSQIVDKAILNSLKNVTLMRTQWEKMLPTIQKASQLLTGKGINGIGLGAAEMPTFRGIMGAMTPMQKGILGAGAVGSVAMGLMPSTNQAVGLRTSADMYAGLSGMTPAQAINQANAVARMGGATSATGPTMAAMQVAYTGGYLGNTLSSKNIMSQLGGMSALTGQTNEQAATAMASANGMGFLRMGVHIRNADGQLKPMNQIINDVWQYIYRGRTDITKDEAMILFNPGSKGGNAIRAVAGNPDLANQIIMGIVARAGNKGKELTANQLSSAKTSLGLIGVSGTSPIATAFNYNSKQANYLQSTYQGQVSGYNMSLNAASDVTAGLTGMANMLGPVTTLLGQLKGVLQTFPGLGGVGGTISGVAGLGASLGMQAMHGNIMSQYLGQTMMAANATKTVGALENSARVIQVGANGVADITTAGSAVSKINGLSKIGSLSKLLNTLRLLGPISSAVGSGASGYMQGKSSHGFNWGSVLSSAGTGAAMGGLAGLGATGGLTSGPLAIIGALLGGGSNAIGQLLGHGGPDTSTTGMGADSHAANAGGSLGIPAPSGTTITSTYGQRAAGQGIKAGFHPGIDLGFKEGTPVKVVADGVVTFAGSGGGYGNHVIVNHGSRSTLYGHLSSIHVRRGQSVSAGTIIGISGGKKGTPGAGNSTGPHLHYEVRDKSGRAVNPLSVKNSKGFKNKLNYGMSDNDSLLSGAAFTGAPSTKNGLSSQDVASILAGGDPNGVVGKTFGGKAYSKGKALGSYSGVILGTGDSRTWAKTLLQKLHYPTTTANIQALTTWAAWEGGQWHNPDHYNPLNTTMPAPGAISTNSEGVKSYTSWDQGYQATIKTLKNGLYGPILKALSSGTNSKAVLKAVNHSRWGSHIPGMGGPDGSPSTSSGMGASMGGASLSNTNVHVNVGGITVTSNKSGPVGVELIINEVTKQLATKMRQDLSGRY